MSGRDRHPELGGGLGAHPGEGAGGEAVRRAEAGGPGAWPRRPARSREGAGFLFVVGAPRSGTTWVQLLLAQHPDVATVQETHLFSRYLGPLYRAWRLDGERRSPRSVGLSNALSPDQFRELCGAFVERTREGILAAKEGARIALEKTPQHVHHGDLILDLVPDAAFLHVIRDPRAVAASMKAAAGSWGRRWAPTGVGECARRWRWAVEEGRSLAGKTSRYREIRYEDLLGQGICELGGVFRWLGVQVRERECASILAMCSIENLRSGDERIWSPWLLRREPQGFFRRGCRADWGRELGARQVRRIESEVGGLMEELGYERVEGRLAGGWGRRLGATWRALGPQRARGSRLGRSG